MVLVTHRPGGTDSEVRLCDVSVERKLRAWSHIHELVERIVEEQEVRLTATVKPLADGFEELVETTAPVLSRLANLGSLTIVDEKPAGSVGIVDPAFELHVALGEHVDMEAELARIEKEMAGISKKLTQVSRKLENPKFLAGAKPEVVSEQKVKYRELSEMLEKLEAMKKDYAG